MQAGEATPSNRRALVVIFAISGLLFAFLMWIVYFKQRIHTSSEFISVLPSLNAFFNASSTALLSCGFVAIRRKKITVHRRFMLSALVSSSLFLVSYVVYHTFHGDTPFRGQGLVRPIYFFILISHIVLSAVVVPMVLSTVYFAFSGRFASHRKIARFTFPVWLYVSATGVAIFVFLTVYN